ncbi:MAG: nitrite reductase large subunit NirB [Thermodesulfobacteriota bacterium]
MSKKKRLVMIGNGMAGMKAIEGILDFAPEMFDITIFGAEKYSNYNRVLLSSVLAGEMSVDDVILNSEKWYREKNIALHLGKRVVEIQRGYRKVIAENGDAADYDVLILATGSNPFIIPIPGVEREGVVTFRDIDDCERILNASKHQKKAAVIGGGLLGLEAAKGLITLGMEVTVIHDQAYLMNMQLDSVAGNMLRQNLGKQGMRFRVSTLTTEILGDDNGGRVRSLKFSDGSEIDCDLVVMAAGIRPNKTLAEETYLHCNRGIVVNDYMQTITDPAIFAVGECVEHRGRTYGLVAPLFEQARILADHITGQGIKSYQGSVISTKLKVSGADVFSAGDFNGNGSSETIEYLDRSGGVYKKLVIRDDKIVGSVMFGDTADGPRFFQMMQDGVNISEQRATLLFGNSMRGNTGRSGYDQVSAMSPDSIVCGCNGVTKQAIEDAIIKDGLTTRQEVTGCTKASGSCGGCGSLVEQILANILGSNFAQSSKVTPMCGCTKFSHDEIKAAIRSNHLTDVYGAMYFMEWKGEGCHVCRPAINYYVQMIWPKEAFDDRHSRLANERMHANIQKDGTFSVVPRIYGGVTTPDELMRIGAVAKKHHISTVKLTGGQRIDLLGVKKEDLVDVWQDLDMPSGFAYGKALRTVKTCVGNVWCRFGTQDSMSLGIRLEETFDRIWTPAKFKMAASGCPRNCAEVSIKDFGVVGIDGGWQLYCGGNGGVKVRATDLLGTVKDEKEVIEIAKAYLQFYREDAYYSERTSVWIERVGLEHVKRHVVEDSTSRGELVKRMDEALATLTEDPWKERIEAVEKDKVEPVVDYQPVDITVKAVNQ